MVRLRGDLLYYLWILLESDPNYVALCEHPISFRTRVEGKWTWAEFHAWALDATGDDHLFTVGYRRKLVGGDSKSSCVRQMYACCLWAEANNVRYSVSTDQFIWRQPQLLSNWAYVLRFLNGSFTAADLELGNRVARFVAAAGNTTLGDIKRAFVDIDPTSVESALFLQIHCGALVADLGTEALSRKTKIRRIPR